MNTCRPLSLPAAAGDADTEPDGWQPPCDRPARSVTTEDSLGTAARPQWLRRVAGPAPLILKCLSHETNETHCARVPVVGLCAVAGWSWPDELPGENGEAFRNFVGRPLSKNII